MNAPVSLTRIREMMRDAVTEKLPLRSEVKEGLKAMGILKPTPIQVSQRN
jgi:superfamily II DNA/RNA helicase